jgi:bis(5'-nucleosyl)-tetraphosphatase (symmetrical)
MALYAIGDVQGCNVELGALLELLKFSSDRDHLWFAGDLVNRGPDSLGVLRRIRGLGAAATVVLGNHDLHLLAAARGAGRLRSGDTLDAVFEARDGATLLDWLAAQPLIHHDPALGLTLVHAGLPPQWDLNTALRCGREFEAALARNPAEIFDELYGDLPDLWSESLTGPARLRFIANCLTRLRYVDRGGRLALRAKGAPHKAESMNLLPWFSVPQARWRGSHVLFGHWSTLGFFRDSAVTGLDTGCVWGGRLTALRLDVPDAKPVSVACRSATRP